MVLDLPDDLMNFIELCDRINRNWMTYHSPENRRGEERTSSLSYNAIISAPPVANPKPNRQPGADKIRLASIAALMAVFPKHVLFVIGILDQYVLDLQTQSVNIVNPFLDQDFLYF